jgi:hypothetical protein
MKTNWKSLALFSGLTTACLGAVSSPARAQGFSFGYAGPGVSVGVTTPGYGYPGGVVVGGGYPVVAPGPVVVAPYPAPYLVRRPVIVPGPIVGPRPIYGPRVFYGPRGYGRYRPYRYY